MEKNKPWFSNTQKNILIGSLALIAVGSLAITRIAERKHHTNAVKLQAIMSYLAAPKTTSEEQQAAASALSADLSQGLASIRASQAKAGAGDCIGALLEWEAAQAQIREDRTRCAFTDPVDISCTQAGSDPYFGGSSIQYLLESCGVAIE